MNQEENTKPTGIGDARYARRGDEKVAEVVVKPEVAEATVPKDKVENDSLVNVKMTPEDIDLFMKCRTQLQQLQKAWAEARTALLTWEEVCNKLRPIIEKPTADF